MEGVGDRGGLLRRVEAREAHGKLVAPDAGHHVLVAGRVLEDPGHRREKGVAPGPAEAVVYAAEVIEVEAQ